MISNVEEELKKVVITDNTTDVKLDNNNSNNNNSTNNDESLEVMAEASDRVLAYVERIISLEPIEGADVIEIATVLGWRVIVKKGLYKPGDLVVYVEIDSVLPPWPYFIQDKLDKCNFRIKTIKLRGQISQGYCIPIKELLNHPTKKLKPIYNVDGDVESGIKSLVKDHDVGLTNELLEISLEIKSNMTDLIGIRKYVEPPIGGGAGSVFSATLRHLKPFPSFLQKTDQPRIQNLPHYPTTYPDVEFEVTEKMEGSSITIYHYRGQSGVCSRNFELNFDSAEKDSEIENVIVKEMKLLERLAKLNENIALQGEFIGPKIQSNIYGLKHLHWKCFDIWLIDSYRYATHKERIDIMDRIGLSWDDYGVPHLGVYKLKDKTLKDLLDMANGFSQLKGSKPKVLREGIVFKSTSIENARIVSFKVISNQYLLKK